MQTRKALLALSKGEKSYEDRAGDQLAERREKYLAQYEQTQSDILSKQAEVEVSVPFLVTIRKKLAKFADTQDYDVPVIAKFDLYSGIGKVASRTVTDVGLKRLATHLERIWRGDSEGVMTYRQVDSLVKMYKDQFPRSKAADAIKAECTKSGMHKLPVAKLARIASRIESQDDYDTVVTEAGIATDRPDHVRSRAFIRGLVAAKYGPDIGEETEEKFDNVADRVASRLAGLEKDADYDMALDLLSEAKSLSTSLIETLDTASMELFDASLERPGQMVQDLSKKIENFVGDLTKVQSESAASPDTYGDIDEQPDVPAAPTAPTAPAAPAREQTPEEAAGVVKKKNDPRTWTFKNDEMPVEPTPEEAAGLKRKWYDPRSWGYKKVQSLLSDTYAVMSEVDGELKTKLARFASKLAQMVPPMDTNVDDLLDQELGPMVPPEDDAMPMGVDTAPMEEMDQTPGSELDPTTELLNDIEEVSQEVIENAPPEAQGYIEHEMSEGHSGEPGSAEWGAEEILNEGHTAPPPSDQWLLEEEQEMHEQGVPHGASKSAADGKSIPLPKGKIKSQPHVTTYAKNVKEDGAKTLKASEIEEAILSGKRVSHAGVSIFVNDNDEIELWNKDAGVACGIEHFDMAVNDFIKMVNKRIAAHKANVTESKAKFAFNVERVANVPCEACGNAYTFPYLKNASDTYTCACGHEISAGSFMELEKVAQREAVWQVTIGFGGMDGGSRKALKWRMPQVLANIGAHRIEDESSDSLVASIWNTSQEGIDTLIKKVQSMGGQATSRRIAQAGGPNMMSDVPEARPGDVVDVTEEMWPDEDILRQVRDLKQSGMAYGQMIQQMIQMGALGTDHPSPDSIEYLDSLIKKARRMAQMAPGGAPAVGGESLSLPDLPIGELANAAFMNYKAQGMSMMEALKAFLSDHKERLSSVGNSADGEIMGAIAANYTSAPTAPGAPIPGAAPKAAPPPPPGEPMMPVASRAAQSKPNYDPSVRKPKDHVKVDKDPGPDSSTKAKVPDAGKPKAQHKPKNKMSPTKMSPDSSTKAEIPLPGKPKIRHLPKDQSGVKLPNPKLDEDLSTKDPFKEPGMGAKPSVKK